MGKRTSVSEYGQKLALVLTGVLERQARQYDFQAKELKDGWAMMCLAVLQREFLDLYSMRGGPVPGAVLRAEAREFFEAGDHVFWCNYLGLEPAWVVELVEKMERAVVRYRGEKEADAALMASQDAPGAAERAGAVL